VSRAQRIVEKIIAASAKRFVDKISRAFYLTGLAGFCVAVGGSAS